MLPRNIGATYIGRVNVLVTCTANRCRSPIAEVLLRKALADRGSAIEVRSAGLLESGVAAVDEAIECVAEVGLDLSSHTSTQLDPGVIGAADLILTMERSHVREIAVMDPRAFAKTFTVCEFLRRAGESWPLDVPVADRIVEVGVGRKPSDVLSAPSTDDVDDPYLDPLAAFEKTRDELAPMMQRVAELLSV